MKGTHVTFAELSDLYDGDLPAGADRERVRGHVGSCRVCGEEYRRLEKTIGHCRAYATLAFPLDDLPSLTLGRIRSARKRRQMRRSLPALAASVLVVAGVGLYASGFLGGGPVSVAGGARGSYSESERVIDIIRKHDATISQVTEEYVEGRVSLARFNDLRKGLGMRRVAYLPIEEDGADAGVHWGDAIEEVGLGGGPTGGYWTMHGRSADAPASFVLFRVYR